MCFGVTAGAAAAAGVEGGGTTHPFRRGSSNTNNTSAGDTASTNKRVRLNPTRHVMTEASMICDVLSFEFVFLFKCILFWLLGDLVWFGYFFVLAFRIVFGFLVCLN